MKKILTLQNIVLSNWKGRNCTIKFNDGRTTITGANGVGKSSLYKAFCWCLTGITDGINKSNHELFDLTTPLTPETPSAKVTIECRIDGVSYKIEREAIAKFIRRRGSSEWEKAPSDTYVYRIDDIEFTASDFNAWIAKNLCPTDMLLYSICGERFANLALEDKQKARKVLESIVGDITLKDFTGDYTLIEERLARYDIEGIIEATKAAMKPLKKRLDEIPALIEDKSRTLAEYDSVDFDGLERMIADTQKEVNLLDEELAGLADTSKPIREERKRILSDIAAIENALRAGESQHITDQKAAYYALSAERAALDSANEATRRRNDEAIRLRSARETELEAKKKDLEALLNERDMLREKRDEVKSMLFTATHCSYCGQELPDNLLEEAKAHFEETRNKELTAIVGRGIACNEKIAACETAIRGLKEHLARPYIAEALLSDEDLIVKQKELEASFIPYQQTEAYAELNRALEALKASLPELAEESSAEIVEKKKSLMEELMLLNRRYGLKDKADEIRSNIASLRIEQKGVATELAHLEGVLAKCAEYIEERASIISNRINSKLHDCKIQMWSLLKNGEVTPDCVVVNKEGVKYATCSNSERIRMNIALQKMFMAHWDIVLPLWVDESSAFSSFNLPVGDLQTVYLYASDNNYLQVS